jgi:hypothetical protein
MVYLLLLLRRYAAAACEITFKQDNIFLLARKLKGKYNKVCYCHYLSKHCKVASEDLALL